jgi:hypothetical protein
MPSNRNDNNKKVNSERERAAAMTFLYSYIIWFVFVISRKY